MKLFFRPLPLLMLLMLCISSGFAQSGSLFADDSPLAITLETDLEAYIGHRRDKTEPDDEDYTQDALLIYPLPDGSDAIVELNIEMRGNFRRFTDFCEIPPIKLDFKRKKSPPVGVFEDQNKLKLVTLCHDEENLIREYMAYKAYHHITPVSYKVRLVDITYVDTKGNMEPIVQKGFLIESDKALAERIGAKDELELPEETHLTPSQIERQSLTHLYLFEALVGNTDWDISLPKNIRFIDPGDGSAPIAVGYDFDWSKIVDAPYSNAAGLERQKIRPLCLTEAEIDSAMALFERKRKGLIQLYKDCPYLSPATKRACIETLKNFYAILKDEDKVRTAFTAACEP